MTEDRHITLELENGSEPIAGRVDGIDERGPHEFRGYMQLISLLEQARVEVGPGPPPKSGEARRPRLGRGR
jgi:hypothetical protein